MSFAMLPRSIHNSLAGCNRRASSDARSGRDIDAEWASQGAHFSRNLLQCAVFGASALLRRRPSPRNRRHTLDNLPTCTRRFSDRVRRLWALPENWETQAVPLGGLEAPMKDLPHHMIYNKREIFQWCTFFPDELDYAIPDARLNVV